MRKKSFVLFCLLAQRGKQVSFFSSQLSSKGSPTTTFPTFALLEVVVSSVKQTCSPACCRGKPAALSLSRRNATSVFHSQERSFTVLAFFGGSVVGLDLEFLAPESYFHWAEQSQ